MEGEQPQQEWVGLQIVECCSRQCCGFPIFLPRPHVALHLGRRAGVLSQPPRQKGPIYHSSVSIYCIFWSCFITRLRCKSNHSACCPMGMADVSSLIALCCAVSSMLLWPARVFQTLIDVRLHSRNKMVNCLRCFFCALGMVVCFLITTCCSCMFALDFL